MVVETAEIISEIPIIPGYVSDRFMSPPPSFFDQWGFLILIGSCVIGFLVLILVLYFKKSSKSVKSFNETLARAERYLGLKDLKNASEEYKKMRSIAESSKNSSLKEKTKGFYLKIMSSSNTKQ